MEGTLPASALTVFADDGWFSIEGQRIVRVLDDEGESCVTAGPVVTDPEPEFCVDVQGGLTDNVATVLVYAGALAPIDGSPALNSQTGPTFALLYTPTATDGSVTFAGDSGWIAASEVTDGFMVAVVPASDRLEQVRMHDGLQCRNPSPETFWPEVVFIRECD